MASRGIQLPRRGRGRGGAILTSCRAFQRPGAQKVPRGSTQGSGGHGKSSLSLPPLGHSRAEHSLIKEVHEMTKTFVRYIFRDLHRMYQSADSLVTCSSGLTKIRTNGL